MKAEGWYVDPFEKHDERWFSDGNPTSLVRDDDSESLDEPPAGEIPETLERVEREELVETDPAFAQPDIAEAGLRVGLNPMDGAF